METRLRRAIAVLALTVSVPALAACGRGFDEQTEAVYQPAPGVNNRDGQVDVLGALVVAPSSGKSGVFIASLANKDQTRADKLTAVAAQGVTVGTGVTPAIPAGGLVNLAAQNIGGIPVTGAGVKPGGYVLVRLTFQNADPVTVRVPVLLDDGPYASIHPSPSPSASTSASPSPSASASATSSPTS